MGNSQVRYLQVKPIMSESNTMNVFCLKHKLNQKWIQLNLIVWGACCYAMMSSVKAHRFDFGMGQSGHVIHGEACNGRVWDDVLKYELAMHMLCFKAAYLVSPKGQLALDMEMRRLLHSARLLWESGWVPSSSSWLVPNALWNYYSHFEIRAVQSGTTRRLEQPQGKVSILLR